MGNMFIMDDKKKANYNQYMDDREKLDIMISLDRIERNQRLIALMIALFWLAWSFQKLFPVVYGTIIG